MKTVTTAPVIFRCFGREENETTWHLPGFLFGYVAAGHALIRSGVQTCTVTAGSSFLIARCQEAIVTLIPDEGEEGYFHTIHMCFSETEVEDYFLHAVSPGGPAVAYSGPLRTFPGHPLLHGLALLLEDGMRRSFRAGTHFVKMKIQECISILVLLDESLYHWLADRNRPQKISLGEFMEKNFRQNVPLTQFARATGRSLSTFRRDCLRELGTTPSRWLIARRLDEARRLLREGQRPGDILVGLGFESFSHFTRRFKQRFGYLPSECNGHAEQEAP